MKLYLSRSLVGLIPIIGAVKYGDEVESVVEGTSTLTSGLLKELTCTTDELGNYLNKIYGYNGTNFADEFASTGKWPDDIQIPKDSGVLKNGNIDWGQVPEGGYILDSVGNAIKTPYTPVTREIIDRYGPSNGRYVAARKW